jgi:hypothetical protein
MRRRKSGAVPRFRFLHLHHTLGLYWLPRNIDELIRELARRTIIPGHLDGESSRSPFERRRDSLGRDHSSSQDEHICMTCSPSYIRSIQIQNCYWNICTGLVDLFNFLKVTTQTGFVCATSSETSTGLLNKIIEDSQFL